MTAPSTHIHALYLRVAPADIAFVKFLFESYEDVGIVRTLDRQTAIIVVLVVPDFLAVAQAILRDLQARIACTEIEPPPRPDGDWLMRQIER